LGSVDGATLALALADRAIETFGSVKATDGQREALANHLTLTAVTWINDEFKLGLPNG
jgi:hypothetical protein